MESITPISKKLTTKRKDIYFNDNLSKIKESLLFQNIKTINSIDEFKKIKVLTSTNIKERTFYFSILYVKVYDNNILFIYENEVVSKKLVHSYEHAYSIQKTQIKSNNINEVINNSMFSGVFAGKIAYKYFNKKSR